MKRLSLYFFLFCFYNGFSQKYNFVNYSVEDGLIQSQALQICQDKYRQLWISTEGGLCKFDGKKFTGYSVQEGLSSNRIGEVLCDSKGNIMAGTEFGISIFNGKNFRHVPLGKNMLNNIGSLVEAADGRIFATNNYKLFVINGNTVNKNMSPDSTWEFGALYKTPQKDLLAYVFSKGLFVLKGKEWKRLAAASPENKAKYFRGIYITHYGDTLLTSGMGLFVVRNGKIIPHMDFEIPRGLSVYSITEDARRNLWLGTDNGAYRISREGILHFDSKNGFTDNTVYHIYMDVENNLWFATDADGIFNFRENTFTYYDKSSGMPNPIIMGIVETGANKMYLAGYGGGLMRLNEKNGIEAVNLDNPMLKDIKISSLYADDKDNIWIGTLGRGAWRYNEKAGLQKIENKGNSGFLLRGGTCFLKDKRGNMLIGNTQGVFLYDSTGQVNKVKMPAISVNSLKQLNDDTVLAGTSNGLYMIDRDYNTSRVDKKEFANSSILCIDIKNNNVWMGTTDRGLLNWNRKTGKIMNYNTASGLPSNFIYSLYVSDKQTVWTGTGFGISNMFLNSDGSLSAVKNYGRAEGLLGMECNHNAVLRASDSGLWFGTTKGLFHFNPNNKPEDKQPLVILKSVKLFSSPVTDSSLCSGYDNWFGTPRQLKLRSGQNHLTFEVGGIYFTNPDALRYRYTLEGIDENYITSANPVIVYASLPPGKYILKVQALTKSGIASVNTIEYPFEIEKAFYQTRLFQILVVLLLISSGALVVYVMSRRKQKRKEILARIREEEFKKLRHRTAEDFHDEVGNKLTRISVLADILKSKMNKEEEETTRIVNQIKENTNALYAGSRDIIWSLNPQNDGIYEIAEHVKDIGASLFNDTQVAFDFALNMEGQPNRKLKLDYSRNLIMAFKEIYNNILKHAGAVRVKVEFAFANPNELLIKVHDNGYGFNAGVEQKGNGLKNIQNRVSRMNGKCEIRSEPGSGTEINIMLKNIFV